MRIEGVAVRQLNAVMNESELGAERRSATHGRVDMQPQIVFTADASDFANRIDRVGGGCSDGSADKAWNQACGDVRHDLLFQRISAHCEIAVDGNCPKVVG